MFTVLAIDAYQEGLNLSRLEGFRMIVAALGGKVERVTATPNDDEWWRLDITVFVPPESQERCTAIASKHFDGAVDWHVVGTREE